MFGAAFGAAFRATVLELVGVLVGVLDRVLVRESARQTGPQRRALPERRPLLAAHRLVSHIGARSAWDRGPDVGSIGEGVQRCAPWAALLVAHDE